MKPLFCSLGAIAIAGLAAVLPHAAPADDPPDPIRVVRLFAGELQVAEYWRQESARCRPAEAVIEHVTVLPMTGEAPLTDRSVHVRDGRIAAITAASAPPPAGARRIDGRGKFLVPGLVDMHVHRLATMANDLLLLLNGVTSVRDMDGFLWMLRQRPKILANELLAPTPYIAGHILNWFRMDSYATVVRTPAAARQAVAEQAQAGYDFIKIHNVLPEAIYDAVAAEAKARGLDLIGHIPHDIAVAHAIQQGQRTLEHFKGYIDDSRIEISNEDWLTATKGAAVWNVPTLYASSRNSLRGKTAADVLALPEMRCVPELLRAEWRAAGERPLDDGARLQQTWAPKCDKVFRALLGIGGRFLVGTDSGGGYDLMVPGFATHHEMELLQAAGMPAMAVLAAATSEPAVAMRKEQEFGTVSVGKRADLLLVDRDPQLGVENLDAIAGVMLRGSWLARADLDRIRQRLEAIAAVTAPWPATKEQQSAFVRGEVEALERLAATGFVLPEHAVREYATAVESLGMADLAERARKLLVDAADR
jgi:imidazolonepropionase-like amidohydrolase